MADHEPRTILKPLAMSSGRARLFSGEHGGGFAFEVDIGFAADVYGDAFDDAAGELVRRCAGIVVGDGGSAIAAMHRLGRGGEIRHQYHHATAREDPPGGGDRDRPRTRRVRVGRDDQLTRSCSAPAASVMLSASGR